jgi:hypothetical protein
MPRWIAFMVDREDENLRAALEYIDTLSADTVLLCGGDRGSDIEVLARATARGLRVIEYRPERDVLGSQAGVRRNRDIVADCDRLIAFHDGKSWGTITAIADARAAGRPVEVHRS